MTLKPFTTALAAAMIVGGAAAGITSIALSGSVAPRPFNLSYSALHCRLIPQQTCLQPTSSAASSTDSRIPARRSRAKAIWSRGGIGLIEGRAAMA